MNKDTYCLIETYMLSCMEDSAHGEDHIYRVLYNALEIAKTEKDVDYDVLISACLLHDIGRKEQFENPDLDHAVVGGEKAYGFLKENGFDSAYAEHVKKCIVSHRFRKDTPPESIEAKILFDADKLEAAGAVGIARTLIYKGMVSDPIYSLLPDGTISDGKNDTKPSFFHEYKYKLEKIYSRFYTARGEELAGERQAAAVSFYNDLFREVNSLYQSGRDELGRLLR